MTSPRKHKDVQSLTERIAAPSQFSLKSTNKCLPFINLLRGSKKFELKEKCESAFHALKAHLAKPRVLSKPEARESLILYLATTEHTINFVLVRDAWRQQRPMYYVSKRLLGAETRYLAMETVTLCLIHASRKLWPYFQVHPIKVYTDQPLRQVLAKP